MAIKIGHAAIDENGKAHSGKAGDQRGNEVCTRTWWAMGWNVLLRPKSSVLAEKSAKACEQACANNNIGYDQWQRNTLHGQAIGTGFDLSKIKAKCECDCSSLMQVCAMAGGARGLAYGTNGYTTRTMVKAFVASGDYEKLTDSKYLTSDKYLMRGDILVKEGSHTVMVLGNGSLCDTKTMKSCVKEGQTWLNTYHGTLIKTHHGALLTVDGSYGAKTRAAALCVWKNTANKKWGYKLTLSNKNFLSTCKAAAKKMQLKQGATGDLVYIAQLILAAEGCYLDDIDGSFGAVTKAAVRTYQQKKKLTVDGVIGSETWYSLFN